MANDRRYCRTHGVYHDTFGDGCPRCRETEESTLRALANTEYRATNPGEYECPHCRYVSLRRGASRCPLCQGSVHADYWSRVRAAEAAAQAEWDRGAPKREAKEKRKSAIARLDSALDSFGQFCGFYYFYLLPVLSYGTFLIRALPDNHERITITLDLLVVVVLALIPVVNWLMCLLPLIFDNAAQSQLFYSGLKGWAIVGGIGAVTGFLVLHARRWAIST